MSLFNWFRMVIGGGTAVFHETKESDDEPIKLTDLETLPVLPEPLTEQRTLTIRDSVGGIVVSWGNTVAMVNGIPINANSIKQQLRQGIFVPYDVWNHQVSYQGYEGLSTVNGLVDLLVIDGYLTRQGSRIELAYHRDGINLV